MDKFQERKKLFDDALNFRKPERVPIVANATSWPILDSDTRAKLSEALSDWELNEKIYYEFIERYDFDSYSQMPGRYNKKMLDALEIKEVVFDDERKAVNWIETEMMEETELPLYHEKREELYWTKIIPRRYPALDMGKLIRAYQADKIQREGQQRVAKNIVEKYHAPLQRRGNLQHPLELLFELRGIKNFSMDMRRRPEMLLEIIEAQIPALIEHVRSLCENPDERFVTQAFLGALGHSILNEKQFEKFYWPAFKAVVETMHEYGFQLGVQWQATLSSRIDFFKELPKHSLKIEIEEDIFKIRKLLPDQCLMGGMPIEYMNAEHKEDAVDYVRRVLGELGGDGIILAANKTMAFEHDGKRENLLAIMEFAKNYKL